jgi:tetratricopeptide (TPR) repeat protein
MMNARSTLSTVIAAAVATGVSVGVIITLDRDPAAPTTRRSAVAVEATASETLNAVDAIAFWSRRVIAKPNDYLSRTQLASQYLRRAREVHNTHDALTADAEIDRVLRQVPSDIGALRVKANARSFVHDFRGGRAFAQRVPDIDATDSTAIALAADAAFELGELDEAGAAYEGLARRLGAAPPIDARLARLLHALGADEQALELARHAVDVATESEFAAVDLAYYEALLAELERGNGNYDAAADGFLAAIRHRPTDSGAIEGLAKVRAAQGRYVESERLWRRSGALIGVPDFHVLAALGDLEFARGNERGAHAYWRRALRAVDSLSGAARIGFLRDESRFRAGRDLAPEQALALARQDLRVREDSLAYDTLAWAQLHVGDADGAQRSIDRALASGVRDASIWYHAAAISAARGDRTHALDFARDALELSPRFDLYEAAGARELVDALSSSRSG